jgi:hypothetical protein
MCIAITDRSVVAFSAEWTAARLHQRHDHWDKAYTTSEGAWVQRGVPGNLVFGIQPSMGGRLCVLVGVCQSR